MKGERTHEIIRKHFVSKKTINAVLEESIATLECILESINRWEELENILIGYSSLTILKIGVEILQHAVLVRNCRLEVVDVCGRYKL